MDTYNDSTYKIIPKMCQALELIQELHSWAWPQIDG